MTGRPQDAVVGHLGTRQSGRIAALQDERNLAGGDRNGFRMKRDNQDDYLSGRRKEHHGMW
ncbi:hypothetical protein CUC44_20690 [Aeromonas lusitana]|uniref:Uncharacterized protein n=1 Tax=Aeromonas lusitana TaxID=931529 RepID=A0A2M8H3Z2_9GAMM|nr:hypothetical protein CUC44_20690 [Aeromonas lusitana]